MTDELQELSEEFVDLRRDLLGLVNESRAALMRVRPRHYKSAENLLHYIALRSRDLRPLQLRLACVGLSSLGRAESHVLAAVDAVLAVLHRARGRAWQPDEQDAPGSTGSIRSRRSRPSFSPPADFHGLSGASGPG
jgi:pyruvate kinase